MSGWAIRLLLAAAATAAIGLAGHALHRESSCNAALASIGSTNPSDHVQVAARLQRFCGDPQLIVLGAVRLTARGYLRDAIALAHHLTASNPQDFLGWLTLGRLLGDRDPPASRLALARAHMLNPLGVPQP